VQLSGSVSDITMMLILLGDVGPTSKNYLFDDLDHYFADTSGKY